MSARAGMSEHIAALRELCHAGTADYSVAGVTYWTDEQLQTVLDLYRSEWRMVSLRSVPELVAGMTVWQIYEIPEALGTWWERATGGSTVWRVTDSLGNVQGTALYTVDYASRRVTFAADQAGTAYYLTGRTYDVQRAAAGVWRRKAAYYAAAVDWQTDGHRVNAGQMQAHCIAMAEELELEAGPSFIQMVRTDARRKP